MKEDNRYGLTKKCEFCNKKFITKPRFIKFCSQSCKNPINRKGNIPWNKGIKLTEEQKKNQNTDGLKLGIGWNKGKKNPAQSERWKGEGNPNWNGKKNALRPPRQKDSNFIKYKVACNKFTQRSVKILKKEGKVPDNTGKYPEDMQLDHIIPQKQGYEEGILPSIIGSVSNLQYITGKENRKKWDTFQDKDTVEKIICEHNKCHGHGANALLFELFRDGIIAYDRTTKRYVKAKN